MSYVIHSYSHASEYEQGGARDQRKWLSQTIRYRLGEDVRSGKMMESIEGYT